MNPRSILFLIPLFILFYAQKANCQIDTPSLARYAVDGDTLLNGSVLFKQATIDKYGNSYGFTRYGNHGSTLNYSILKMNGNQGIVWRKPFVYGTYSLFGQNRPQTVIIDSQIIIVGPALDSFIYDSAGTTQVTYCNERAVFFLRLDLDGNYQSHRIWNQGVYNVGLIKNSFGSLKLALSHNGDSVTLETLEPKFGARQGLTSIKMTGFNTAINSTGVLNTDTFGNTYVTCQTFGAGKIHIRNDTTITVDSTRGFYMFKFNTVGRFMKSYNLGTVGNATVSSDGQSIFVHGNMYNVDYISIDTPPVRLSTLPKSHRTFVVASYTASGKLINYVSYQTGSSAGTCNSCHGYVSVSNLVGDSMLQVLGLSKRHRKGKGFDLDPSPNSAEYINFDAGDTVEPFISFLDTGLNFSQKLRVHTEKEGHAIYLSFDFISEKQALLSTTTFQKRGVDLDFGNSKNYVGSGRGSSTVFAVYHLDNLGPIDTISGPQTVCWSNDSVVTYSIPSVKNAQWYDWKLPAGTQIIGRDSLRTISLKFPINFKTHSLAVTARRDGQKAESKVLQISTVNTLSPLSFVYGDKHICVGDSVLLLSGANAIDYAHYVNGFIVQQGSSAHFRADSLSNGSQYFVKMKRANSCLAITKTITFRVDTPIKSGLVIPSGVCQGSPLKIRMLFTDSFYLFKNHQSIYQGKRKTLSYYNYLSTDTFWAIGIDSNGCPTPTDTHTLKVHALPAVSAGNDTSVCLGDSIRLRAAGAHSYTWEPLGFQTGQFIIPTKQGVYVLEGKSINGCIAYDTLIVGVNPLPNVIARSDTDVCAGDSLELYATGASTYNWIGVLGGKKYLQPITEGYYHVTGVDQKGCESRDSFYVTINELPKVSAGLDKSGCLGDSVWIYSSIGPKLKWSDGLPNGHYHSIFKTDTLSVSGTNSKGCSSTDTMVVLAHPDPTFKIMDDTSVCPGEELVIEAIGPHTFLWNNGHVNGVKVKPQKKMTYRVTARDQQTRCESEDSVKISLYSKPQVIAMSDTNICLGDTIYPSASGAKTYSWSNGLSNGQAYASQKNEELVVIGTDTNGCRNRDTVKVGVYQLPKPYVGSKTQMSRDDTLIIYPGSFSTYSWHNKSSDSTFSLKGRAIDTGEYLIYVFVTDHNGCGNSDSVVISVSASGISQIVPWQINIYPNPASTRVVIESEISFSHYVLIDSKGKAVLSGTNKREVDVSTIAKGIYSLHLHGDGRTKVKKLVIE